MNTLQARQVGVGDEIEWCGQWVVVEDVQMVRGRGGGTQKPGRKFKITPTSTDGRQLPPRYVHYLYDEVLRVVRRVEGEARRTDARTCQACGTVWVWSTPRTPAARS